MTNPYSALIERWAKESNLDLSDRQISIRLTLHTVARVNALQDKYPLVTRTRIIDGLLSLALDLLEQDSIEREGGSL